ncbi:MAG: cob(I)yrinic acid a,c-diamide adenosyltransferase [Deltaproteobacteria bacterium]|nr:cob(I)yrinic acid a,c-diamide adenosyltransferase [Deltaproteobacteria bacterium]
MSIYTKTGDRGQTALLSGKRVEKDDPRVSSYGELDELSAVLGVSRSQGLDPSIAVSVARIQEELFTLCSQLASAEKSHAAALPRVQAEWVLSQEREIDAADAELPTLRQFILPGGSPGAAWLHLARTVCRRAERSVVTLARREEVDPVVLAYVNRLSDWLFTMARLANHRAGTSEPIWRKPS